MFSKTFDHRVCDCFQWIKNPEHDFVNNYISFREANPRSNFHIVHPQYLWRLWDYLQDHTTAHIRRNPPSSGFLGILDI